MINNNLQHISKGLDEVMIDITVKCMLNPDNRDFYIGTLTLDKVKALFIEMNIPDTDISTVFWSAFSRAQALYLEMTKSDDLPEEDDSIDDSDICPECGCRTFVSGVRCPNCDYEDED